MRTSVAFLSSMALATARAVAFDVRAIGVLLVDMMLKYIGFHHRRQQICRRCSASDSCADVGRRNVGGSQSKADQGLRADSDVKAYARSRVQVQERRLGKARDERQNGKRLKREAWPRKHDKRAQRQQGLGVPPGWEFKEGVQSDEKVKRRVVAVFLLDKTNGVDRIGF